MGIEALAKPVPSIPKVRSNVSLRSGGSFYSEDVETISGSLMASRCPSVGRANTKRNVEGTMNSDRPSLPRSKRPLGLKFASTKMVGSLLYMATGCIAIWRTSPSG